MTLTEQTPSQEETAKPKREHQGPPQWLNVGLMGFIAFLLGFLVFVPITHGGYFQVFPVQGHSMEPTYSPGSHVIIMRTKDYEVDDIVIYKSPVPTIAGDEFFIVHRIIDRNEDGTWVIQGDNNPNTDPEEWDITSSDLLGKVIIDW